MKKILLTLVLMVGVVLGLFAQNLTYQAVIRDNNQQLVVNTAVKATFTITFTSGDPYQAEFNGSTNLHGLLSFEFGDESLVGRDWTGATIAVKVVNSATSSIVYVNDEPRPVSAVPYALSVNGQYIQNYLTEHNYVDLTKLNDTLDAYSTTDVLNGLLQQLSNKLDVQIAKLDSIAHIVDSLAKLPHGGDTPTVFTCGTDKVKDVDLNEYNTVKIGNQCWMAQNLRTTTKRNGVGNIYTGNTQAGYNAQTYGYYYDWAAVMQGASSTTYPEVGQEKVQGICPTGWHVPSDAEWDTLTDYVKSKLEYQCSGNANIANALSSATGWTSPSSCGAGYSSTTLNKTGFAAVPAGNYDSFNARFISFGTCAFFWSATQGTLGSWCRCLYSDDPAVGKNQPKVASGFSVRCLRDPEAGGDEPTPCTPTSSTHNIEISISELPYTFGDTTFQTGTTAGTYTLHRTNVDGCDSTITINLSFFTCGTDKVKDVDYNEYNTVAIGNQCWMKENMKTTRYANNTAINGSKMFNPDNNQNNVAIYGKLYTWSAATRDSSTTYPAEGQVKVQGICPTGWHVPSKAEFDTLTNHVKGKTDCKCGIGIANALSSPTGWNNRNNTGCNAGDNSTTRNKTGFSAVPTGYYYVGIGTSGYDEFGDCAYFWCATQRSDDNKEAYSLYLTKNSVAANDSHDGKGWGFSVRCLKD